MHTITKEALIALVQQDWNKDDLIADLIAYHPAIFVKLLQKDDLTWKIQQAYVEDSPKGNKIRAIKEYRSLTGTSLKESREAVEDMIINGYIRPNVGST